jgi:hypothetical protein
LARARYRDGYAILGLRDRAARTVHEDGHHDLWLRLQCIFDGLAAGQPALALPAFGGLFAPSQCLDLDGALLGNAHLLRAIRALTWVPSGRGLARVNWRDMGSEEFGSVYESLLELVPHVRLGEPHPFRFLGDESEGTEGNARKLSGSYYTPDSLVQVLLDSALEPVIAQRIGTQGDGPAAADALLSLNVIDPACGSGHFLLGASRRIAGHLAQLRTDGTPSAAEYRAALRQVITHCIYGTDKNGLAIELARMALWLEAATPDAPLGFLDHHLHHGDSLLGLINLGVLTEGIPDEAYDALASDDPVTAKTLKRRNRQERTSLEKQRAGGPQFALLPPEPLDTEAFTLLEGMPDDTPQTVEAKRIRAELLTSESAAKGVTLAANLYVSAFLTRKQGSGDTVPTTRDVLAALQDQKVPDPIRRAALEITTVESFTHWKLAFPQVFSRGGFDVVIGNPPWEKVKLAEKEFFSNRAPEVVAATNAAERRRRIQALSEAPRGSVERRLFEDYERALRSAEGIGVWLHTPNRFALTGHGDVNLYAVFAETFLRLAAKSGRAGIIVPSGICTDAGTSLFFRHLVESHQLFELNGFDNQKKLFPSVHPDTPFCLLVTAQNSLSTRYAHYLLSTGELADERRHFHLSSDEMRMINPNTVTCPIFRSERDAELTKKIYGRVPVLNDERKPAAEQSPWGISFLRMFDMSNDSGLFHSQPGPDRVPLYEAKMIHQYDHRWASYGGSRSGKVAPEATDVTLHQKQDPTFDVVPRYWVDRDETEARLSNRNWMQPWLLGFRGITNATNERTIICGVFPRAAVGNSLPLVFPTGIQANRVACLVGCLSSLVLDFVARQKVGGTNLNFFIVEQLAVLAPGQFSDRDVAFIAPRVGNLTCTSNSMQGWATSIGCPLISSFDPAKRAIARAELDAWYADRYGLTRDELRYVLDPTDALGADYPSETFRVLKKNETAEFGEYRTARLVLDAWDRVVVPARAARGAE